MILFRHSSATIRTSDSLSSLQSKNISMAIPSSFWNSGDVLLTRARKKSDKRWCHECNTHNRSGKNASSMQPNRELITLKFPPQRLSHYVFTYCQAVSHPVLLRVSLFFFSVKMKRSEWTDRKKRGLERKEQAESQINSTPGFSWFPNWISISCL